MAAIPGTSFQRVQAMLKVPGILESRTSPARAPFGWRATQHPNLTATGGVSAATLAATNTAGSAIIDADAFGKNSGAFTPGLRFGGASSGEGIISNRVGGNNAFGLQLFTEFTPRISILQNGMVWYRHNQSHFINWTCGRPRMDTTR